MKRNFRIAAQALAIIGFAWLGSLIPQNIIFSKTNSLNDRFFIKLSGTARQGEYAVFNAPQWAKDRFKDIDSTLIKKVSCSAGQTVKYEFNALYCDEKIMSIAPRDPKTQEPLLTFTGIIPSGKIYVTGDHLNSLDSRFFGLIDESQSERAIGIF